MFSCPIRVHSWFKHCLDYVFVFSCPFVVHPLPPPSRLSCFSCFSWFKHCLDHVFVHSCPFVVQASIWTTFVSIRVHSLFSRSPLLRVFSCISCFSWFKHCLDYVRVHSCPFVVLPLPSSSCFSCFSCFSWFRHCLDYVFAYSCPFVSIRGSPSSPPLRVFRGLILPSPFSLLVQFFLFSTKST